MGTWSQELIQRPWSSADYWIVPRGLLSLLFCKTPGLLAQDDTLHNDVGPSTLITNLKNTLQVA